MQRRAGWSRPDAQPRRPEDALPASAQVQAGLPPAVWCPECGMPAWVEWTDAVGAVPGAVVLAKVRCFARHWFLMPVDRLPR